MEITVTVLVLVFIAFQLLTLNHNNAENSFFKCLVLAVIVVLDLLIGKYIFAVLWAILLGMYVATFIEQI